MTAADVSVHGRLKTRLKTAHVNAKWKLGFSRVKGFEFDFGTSEMSSRLTNAPTYSPYS